MNVELAQAATVFEVLCVRLQRLWLLLMAVYRLGNISTQMKNLENDFNAVCASAVTKPVSSK